MMFGEKTSGEAGGGRRQTGGGIPIRWESRRRKTCEQMTAERRRLEKSREQERGSSRLKAELEAERDSRPGGGCSVIYHEVPPPPGPDK